MEEKNAEKELNYYRIKEMEEHAKEYETAPDKKDFLRTVSAYEQKIILLNSKKPYEVFKYLDELDLKNSRQILNELSYDEIKQILELFTTEDKQNFYKSFSDLSLVNQFIVHDKSSSDYIKDLSFDRKVDLMDSSNKNTVIASAKIYETMPEEERSVVPDVITSSDSISTLNEVTEYVESNEISNKETNTKLNDNESNELTNSNDNKLLEVVEEMVEEKTEEEMSEEINKEISEEINKEISEEINKEISEEINKEINEEINKEINEEITTAEEENHQIENLDIEEHVTDDVNAAKNNESDNKDSIVNNIDDSSNMSLNKTTLEEFESAKQQAEQIEIQNIIQNITPANKDLDMTQEHVKTL